MVNANTDLRRFREKRLREEQKKNEQSLEPLSADMPIPGPSIRVGGIDAPKTATTPVAMPVVKDVEKDEFIDSPSSFYFNIDRITQQANLFAKHWETSIFIESVDQRDGLVAFQVMVSDPVQYASGVILTDGLSVKYGMKEYKSIGGLKRIFYDILVKARS